MTEIDTAETPAPLVIQLSLARDGSGAMTCNFPDGGSAIEILGMLEFAKVQFGSVLAAAQQNAQAAARLSPSEQLLLSKNGRLQRPPLHV